MGIVQGKNPTAVISELVPLVAPLGDVFTGAGFEIALVGGPVRDALLGQAPHDLDLTTSARPEEIETVLRPWADAVWDVGRNFGTIGARKGDASFEITTYRCDEYQRDSRKPLVKFGDTLEGDLWRRDFTVNAMALRLPEMTLVDPTGGERDLEQQMLRTPISPEESFNDDPLRIMRAARFAAQLGFDIDYSVLTAMQDMRERLQIVSRERIQAEFSRLLVSPWPRRGLELMVYTDVAAQVVPELMDLRDMQDEHKRHKDVWEHSLIVLEQAIAQETGPDGPVPEPDLVLRLAALLHDIGKPATRRFEGGGVVTFHQHDVVGAKIARRRLRELKYDKATIRDVSRLIALHQRFHGYGEQPWTDSAVRRYVTDAGPLLQRLHRLTRADCTTRNVRKAERLSAAYDDLEARIAALQAKEELDAVRPELDGSEIMEILGISPGPQVGKAYKYLLAYRMENGLVGHETAETVLREWWEKCHNGQATGREGS
ncbi:poly(A) polymerase [Mobiluncus mulieris]|uniref:CCA-adding enzyme n=1 Tax=Mobiluncus mulieris TaxID=2052 RepID=A0A8G2HVE8_9ACTO|nr:CCA tRNA nucleotidyltransferase [Mobiluncus mulieris]MBB5847274.1 poly(A) polymerase [Mobiluncus mulieris]MCU9971849.1 CCA tRNA nucleotidyltransferase [Mobiluncus mulieris]MCU9976299.1 CCA tRNA nucleotidyltransferase [Mobiluncus mulieris]MCV0002374.1 CCA tRNA nucleotidyltransferase [Mobiluncus mulieris]MCV0011403.1 CCA tRNA nucleotidyltransferase [Mobiluncus mulieris]